MKGNIARYAALVIAIIAVGSCASKEPNKQMADNIRGNSPKSAKMMEYQEELSISAPSVAAQPAPDALKPGTEFNTDEYNKIVENEFKDSRQNPLSTFSIDVDKASYANVRNYLAGGSLPPADAVRIEELVNYFTYDYPEPKAPSPFSITTELADTPWNKATKLFLIGIQGRRLDYQSLKPCNLVFLIDTSGSMSAENKLPLLKEALGMLVRELSAKDRIAIVAYAGSAGTVLDSTQATDAETIIGAMDKLSSGGSTAGGEGIELAYQTARKNYIPGGNNRVILCTDGDFNVGNSSTGGLVDLITEKRKEDIYLTICGFGMGNYKDGRMEEISKAGNGNYFYIDSRKEAEKVFIREMRANMFTIAKDVKIQLEFNPAVVKSYRLIGYENRLMAAEDFKDDTKDAGELGPGHTVTALYEVVMADAPPSGPGQTAAPEAKTADPLKYQQTDLSPAAASGEMLTVKFRYKPVKSDVSVPIELPVSAASKKTAEASENFRFAAAVTEFGMLLRKSQFSETATWDSVLELAKGSMGKDDEGYRAEFIDLVSKARAISNK